jgi:hypothetical protein
MELAVDYLMGILEETHPAAMGTVDLCLPNVDYLSVLEELRSVEGRLNCQHSRRTVLYHQQLFESQLDGSELPTDEGSFVV